MTQCKHKIKTFCVLVIKGRGKCVNRTTIICNQIRNMTVAIHVFELLSLPFTFLCIDKNKSDKAL